MTVRVGSFTFTAVDTLAAVHEWLRQWLPAADAPLDRRATVLCSADRVHALRCAVIEADGNAGRLAGVSCLDPGVLARQLLVRVGELCEPGWEEVRRLRIHDAFAAARLRPALRYFNADQLQSGRGYAEAFARLIGDLESSNVTPALLAHAAQSLAEEDPLAGDRLHDVAVVWADADAGGGALRSHAGLLRAAACTLRELGANGALTAPYGACAALLTASPSAALIEFLAALPDCRVVLLDARPQRTGTQRWRPPPPRAVPAPAPRPARKGEQLALDFAPSSGTRPPANELELVRRYAFATSDVVADPLRPRSAGPDGTADIEEYPGVDEEIAAAVGWVSEQIAAGTALEDIAVVVPAADPHTRLLVDRLAGAGDVAAYAAGGLPLRDAPAGVRLVALLRALERGLEAEATIAVLPALRTDVEDDAGRRLSPSRAAEIVYGAGIVGGAAGDDTGVGEWLPRLISQHDTLRALLADLAPDDGGEPDKRRHLRTRREAVQWLADVEPRFPALAALQELALQIAGGAPLQAVWPCVRTFAVTHLRVPPEPAAWLGLIDEHLRAAVSDPIAASVAGCAAATYLRERVATLRYAHGRYGEPRVFVGTAARAAGLPFRAVRVLGLAEGIVPGTPHDDPIVPNELRVRLEECLRPSHPEIVIPRLEDHVLEDLHAVGRVVAGTRERLALSAPRQWVDRSEREVSGVILEVAAALGRGAEAGEGDVPTSARLRSAYYAPARAARAAGVASSIAARSRIAGGARRVAGDWQIPASWDSITALSVTGVRALERAAAAPVLTASDGVVEAPWVAAAAPGLSVSRPISASALSELVACPYRFLLHRVLYRDEPVTRPSTDTIDAAPYGSLLHAVAEQVFGAHGAAICAHEGRLEDWQERAAEIATTHFDRWLAEYPLRGADAVARERRRLLQHVAQLVHIEWQMPRRQFIAAEHAIGDPTPVVVPVPGGALHVAGQIDRVDALQPSRLSVRDLKTGRVRDFREEAINSGRDLQIGLYTLALEAADAGVEVAYAAYIHPSTAQDPARAFEQSDLKTLRTRTRAWLGVARGLLAAGIFPRTPNVDDCQYCPFRPACGDGAQAASEAKLSVTEIPEAAAFYRLKQQERSDAD